MTTPEDDLVEAAVGAHRPASTDGGLRFHPAFHDLDAAGRERLFVATAAQRFVERALDPDGLTSTAHAVLRRIRGGAMS